MTFNLVNIGSLFFALGGMVIGFLIMLDGARGRDVHRVYQGLLPFGLSLLAIGLTLLSAAMP